MTRPSQSLKVLPRIGLLRGLRKKIGFAKYVLLDGGHREVRYRARLAWLNRRASRMLDLLASKGRLGPVATPEHSDVEMHTLCGHEFVTMGIWSLLSILRFAEGKVALVLHSDGTITDADVDRFRHFFPNIRIVFPEESLAWAEDRLAGGGFELLHHFHAHNSFGPKLLRPHMSEGARTVIMMDTDILFFQRPSEILDRALMDGAPATVTGFEDGADWLSTLTSPGDIEAACGRRIDPRFNAGMVVLSRFDDDDYHFLERNLRSFKPEWREHYFAEQISLALVAERRGWDKLPKDRYRIGPGDPTTIGPECVAIHYPSNKYIRPRFFTEGLPHLIRGIEGPAPS